MKEDHNSSGLQAPTPVFDPSNRPSNRFADTGQERPETGGLSADKGNGSIPLSGIPSPPVGAQPAPPKTTRLSRAQLVEIEGRLSARDHAVLMAIRKYRYLTSGQIGRLYITDCSSKSSQTRQQNLLLQRLGNHGLIRPLKRRVGGYGGGSSVQVWHLTEAGQKLLTLNDPGDQRRKRTVEPSALFLNHTLAVAEAAVQLTTICRGSDDLTLVEANTEPACWRRFKDGGRVCYLKPDLFAITTYEDYEDRWFIEMDLGSESTRQIIEKCNTYLRYYYSGIEQKETGIFPFVVWIVKDDKRKALLRETIKENLTSQPKMFLVIVPDELEKMVRQYIDQEELC